MDDRLLAYRMPITKIIEDNSVKNVRDLEVGRYQIPIFKVDTPSFQNTNSRSRRRKINMQRHISSDRTVHISREKLIEKMQSNRTEHRVIYDEAVEGYAKAVFKCLTDLRDKAGNDALLEESELPEADAFISEFNPGEYVEALTALEKPQHFLAAYDEAIELFSWDEAETVKLTVDEFRKYVLDKWEWQGRFLGENAGYSTSAVRKSMSFSG